MTVLSKHCLCFRSGDSLNTVLVRIFVLCHAFRKYIVLEFLNFFLYKIVVLCHDFQERYRYGVLIAVGNIYINRDYMFVKEDRFETYFVKYTQHSKPQLGSVSILEVATTYRF